MPYYDQPAPTSPNNGLVYHYVRNANCTPVTDFTRYWSWNGTSPVHYVGTGVDYGIPVYSTPAWPVPPLPIFSQIASDTGWGNPVREIEVTARSEWKLLHSDTALGHFSGTRGIRIRITARYLTFNPVAEEWFDGGAVSPSAIQVLGKSPDCNGEILLNLAAGTFNVTPSITGHDYVMLSMFTATKVPSVGARCIRHPAITTFALPTQAALNLYTDLDDCLPNNDPSLANPNTANNDCVPTGFDIRPFWNNPPTFPTLTGAQYNIVTLQQHLDELHASAGDYKIVTSIAIDGVPHTGISMVVGSRPSIIISANTANNATWLHEMGHCEGIGTAITPFHNSKGHRTTGTSPQSALMWDSSATRISTEVNRAERIQFETSEFGD